MAVTYFNFVFLLGFASYQAEWASVKEVIQLNLFVCHFATTTPGGAVVQRVERWACNQQVVGSNPTRGKAA